MYLALPENKRYVYSSVRNRKVYDWPEGRQIAVYIAINVENFAFGEGDGVIINHKNREPDVSNYSWRDYGNRVGIWRLYDLCKTIDIPVSLIINASIYEYSREIVDAFRLRGDEIIAHGYTNSESQSLFSESEEKEFIKRITLIHEREDGIRPQGWLSPWLAETKHTSDILKLIGYSYTLNWNHDEQPTMLQTTHGKLVAIPYPQELNDIPAIMIKNTSSRDFADMIIDNYEELISHSDNRPVVMGIAVHPYIIGQPHRMHHLRRALNHVYGDKKCWKTTPGRIAQYVTENNLVF